MIDDMIDDFIALWNMYHLSLTADIFSCRGVLVRKAGPNKNPRTSASKSEEPVDERLKNIEPKMVELIQNEVCNNQESGISCSYTGNCS